MEHRILLVCAGGLSTGILMKKMQRYWDEQGVELFIKATGVHSFDKYCDDYDIIMVGPQVAFYIPRIMEETELPIRSIPTLDYGMQNCESIMELATELYIEKKYKSLV